jgi:uncharacterized protein CbrC (UPF0167 family)
MSRVFGRRKGRSDDVQPLPDFPYHPDPVATGSIEPGETECVACDRARGWVYVGPVFSVDELSDCLCPWCIADGSAAKKFDATFTDVWGVPADVPAQVVAQVTQRTPGFSGWQQERWMYHCGDACAFLGRAGYRDLEDLPDALEVLRHEHDDFEWTTEQTEEYLTGLDPEGQPTAYLFRCRACGAHLAYSDFT